MVDGKKRIIFLGPPSSGKGTQAAILAKKLGIPAISTGEMLRASVAAGTDLGRRVKDVMARGELVDDELMAEIVRERLAQEDAAGGFLLDGYPRTPAQAQTLQEILEEGELDVDVVLLIDAPEDVLTARALGRGREDDREDVIRERLRVYKLKTAPLVDFYEKRKILRKINGSDAIEDVGRAILKALGAEP